MLINLSEVFTLEGKTRSYQARIEFKTIAFAGSDFEIVSGEPVELEVTNLGNRKLMLTGRTSLELHIPCARCLEPVPYTAQISMEQVLDMSKSDEERVEDLDEQPYLSGYNLDVDQLVLNELLLSLPMKILCSEDCKGICNRCGTNLNHGTCDCDTWSPSLGMSVIQDIFKQSKEV